MGILDIDYDNLVVNNFLIKDRMVYQIDNFYKYPNLVAALFNKHKKSLETSGANYPGKILKLEAFIGKTYFEEHLTEVKNILAENGCDHTKFVQGEKGSVDYGNFSLYSEDVKNEKSGGLAVLPNGHIIDTTCNPHTDSHSEDSMIYMSTICCLSKRCHGGTGIYYNKHLKTFTAYDAVKALYPRVKAFYDRPSKELDSIVESSLKDLLSKQFPRQIHNGCMHDTDEHFELLHFFPMKFNRMIFFDGDMLHAMYAKDISFFDTNERLTINYFMSARKPPEQEIVPNEEVLLLNLVNDVAKRSPYVHMVMNPPTGKKLQFIKGGDDFEKK